MTATSPAMAEHEYRSAPGLNYSAMKDLAVSPLRFWFRHINPDRLPDDPTPEMQIGSAVHCLILEPGAFADRYACELIAPVDCLVTIEDLRGWIRSKGQTPKGTRKDELIAQAYGIPGEAPQILETLRQAHADETLGKTVFKADNWQRVQRSAESLLNEPRVQELLSDGCCEASLFATDPETGITLKGRLDWMAPNVTVDLKTFAQKRGKSIDKSVADAIFYEGYYRQAYFYSLLRGWPKTWGGDFVLAFVETEEPHEVRIRMLRPKVGAEVNLYWERARIEVREMIRLYSECSNHFGVRPWRYAQDVTPLMDEEMPGLAY